MYNTELPTHADLPSSRQLIRSTLIAAVSAGALLMTTVMPAEYGIDPTGIGGVLGLKRMGEIKASLASEAAKETPVDPAPVAVAPAAATDANVDVAASKASSADPGGKADEISVTLKPGQAAEVKLDMNKGSKVTYRWVVRGGSVNFDTHGDPVNPPAGFYHGYGKGRQSTGDEGVLEAAFDGKHGWYWRNRSKEDAIVTLSTKGGYSAIKRVL
ncbi:transmembrane anchor protein [Polaromonas sp. AER18D-145]|uniref:transmembrane anchor protein n=1 Tax=Polaromonas sp. AER18D-145 TaxID=1977060 RepID=UPI000BBCC907|nr:transmembrane anchor protein [Polaromonas sp. AER18D-145]